MTFKPNSPEFAGKTRAQRFLVLRDAILAHSERMVPDRLATKRLVCGPFDIGFAFPGVFDRAKCNMQIWPNGSQDGRHIMYGHKVANVNWDHHDMVEIVSYRSGPWEDELLHLLRGNTVDFLSPRRRGR
jgi:hypothetical protein